MIERTVALGPADSPIETFLCAPERGGPHPAVTFYMDGFGIRDELRSMARRLAATGYVVALPDLFHRLAGDPDYADPGPDGDVFALMLRKMRSLTNAAVIEDTAVVLEHLAGDELVRPGPVGALGYCMSGQFILSALAAFPDRFASAAIFYGVGMATDEADSPHLSVPAITAEVYLGCAGDDPFVPASVRDTVEAALRDAGCRYELELYPGLNHGFAFPQRPAYDLAGAERHWERLHDLFARTLTV